MTKRPLVRSADRVKRLVTGAAGLLAAAALAACGGDADGAGAPRAIDYVRDSGGIVNYHVHVHVSADGIATVAGDPLHDCTGARLPAARLARLQRAITAARLAHTRSRDEPQVEAPSREFRSGGHVVRFAGWRRLPKRIERLTKELEAVANTACRR